MDPSHEERPLKQENGSCCSRGDCENRDLAGRCKNCCHSSEYGRCKDHCLVGGDGESATCHKRCSPDRQKGASSEEDDDDDCSCSYTECESTHGGPSSKHSTCSSPERNSPICFSPVPSVIESTTSLSSIRSFPEYNTNHELAIDDITSSLSTHVGRRHKELIKACRNFDTKATGKITKSQLKQVLRIFCLPLTAAQFQCLTKHVVEDERGKVNYVEFFKSLRNFSDSDSEENSADYALTVDQLVILFQNKIYPCLHDVIRSFWLFDYNKDGFVKKNDLKKILKNYCLHMSDSQFRELWQRYETKDTGLLNYTEFLSKLGIHSERIKNHLPKFAPRDDPLWEEPCNKQCTRELNYPDSRRRAVLNNTDDPSVSGLNLVEITKYFISKLNKCGELVNRVLYMFDRLGDGKINLDDLHHALSCFIMPMSEGMFKKILAKLQVDVTPVSRSVDIREFLNEFCLPDPKARRKEFLENLRSSGCKTVVDDIKNRVVSPGEKIRTELEEIGKDSASQITRQDVRKIIENGLEYPLTSEKFKTLVSFLDPKETNRLSRVRFLWLFESPDENGTSDSPGSYPLDHLGLAPSSLGKKYSHLTGRKLLSKMKYHISKNQKSFDNAILACDPNNCKLVTVAQMRAILDNFCFPLTNIQFLELERNFKYQGDRLEYEKFLKIFEKKPGEDSSKWCRMVDKLSKFKTTAPKELPLEEIEELLVDAIRAKHKKMLQDFSTLDPCKLGFCYKEDVRAVLQRYVIRMSTAQFEHLWKKFPLNQHDCLLYKKLIDSYVGPERTATPTRRTKAMVQKQSKTDDRSVIFAPEDTSRGNSDKNTFGEQKADEHVVPSSRMGSPPVVPKNMQGKKPSGDKEYQEVVFSAFPYLRKTYNSMRPQLMKHITIIRQHLRRMDRKRTGIVNFEDLRTILEKHKIKMTEEDKYFILEYFDKNLTGQICYRDFFRLFAWYA